MPVLSDYPSPTLLARNGLLALLPPSTRARLAPALRRHVLAPGDTLETLDQPLDAVWFPETAVVSLAIALGGGEPQEIGVIGNDGMVGWCTVIEEDRTPYQATVMVAGGSALALPADMLRSICAAEPAAMAVLVRFAHRFSMQVARTLVSNLRDPAERKIARLLLMLDDRVDGDVLLLTHRAIGATLNLRRATVTDTLHVLEGDRMVRCTRGRIVVRDRPALEEVAGASYGVVEQPLR